MRTDSVEGTIGTSSRSAALNTLSETSEIDGAQSRIARSYSPSSAPSTLLSRCNGCLRLSSSMSRWR